MADISNKQAKAEKFNPEESNLIKHARRELALAGIGDSDSDYGGALEKCILDLVTLFAKQRHSGGSAEITKQILLQLLSFEVLTPLTDDPAEWNSVSEMSGYPLWQNIRGPAYFSKDGGKTWFRSDTKQTGRSMSRKEFDAKKKASQEEPKTTKK